jgi:hypothetical protein
MQSLFKNETYTKMNVLPSIFKNQVRFSERYRPEIGLTVVFSHAIQLSLFEFFPEMKDFNRADVFNGAKAMVVQNWPHVIEVKFEGADETDLVSPEFLTTGELTAFGEQLFESNLPPETRKLIIGVAEV